MIPTAGRGRAACIDEAHLRILVGGEVEHCRSSLVIDAAHDHDVEFEIGRNPAQRAAAIPARTRPNRYGR